MHENGNLSLYVIGILLFPMIIYFIIYILVVNITKGSASFRHMTLAGALPLFIYLSFVSYIIFWALMRVFAALYLMFPNNPVLEASRLHPDLKFYGNREYVTFEKTGSRPVCDFVCARLLSKGKIQYALLQEWNTQLVKISCAKVTKENMNGNLKFMEPNKCDEMKRERPIRRQYEDVISSFGIKFKMVTAYDDDNVGSIEVYFCCGYGQIADNEREAFAYTEWAEINVIFN